jgi:hypothetical protein
MKGINIKREEAWTPQDQVFARMIGLLTLLGDGMVRYQTLVGLGEREEAAYMAEDLGFSVEAVPVGSAPDGLVH